jgi:hypothetical protein
VPLEMVERVSFLDYNSVLEQPMDIIIRLDRRIDHLTHLVYRLVLSSSSVSFCPQSQRIHVQIFYHRPHCHYSSGQNIHQSSEVLIP